MDCSLTQCAAGLALVVVLVAYLLRRRQQHFAQFVKLGIPGPPPSILWGNMWSIFVRGHLACQKEWHEKYGPVVGFFFGYQPVLLVADVELLKKVLLRDFTDFADRAGSVPPGRRPVDSGLTNLKGQRWKSVRSTLTPSFTSSKLKQLTPEVCKIVDDFIANVDKHFAKDEEFDMYGLYQALTLDTICRSALGVDFHIQKDGANSTILKNIKMLFAVPVNVSMVILSSFPSLFKLIGPLVQGSLLRLYNKGQNPVEAIRTQCREVIKLRRSNPEHRRLDLLQLMIDAQGETATDLNSLIAGDDADKSAPQCPAMSSKGKALTDAEVVDNAFVVLIAGYETTSSSLAFISRMLLRFPEVQETLRRELLDATENGTVFDFDRLQHCQYLEAVIQECLRMYPPVFAFTTRQAAVDKHYDDLTIPKGMQLFASVKALHSNPEIFPNPEEFQPSRFLPENKTSAMSWAWQPFGAGPRNCIGMRFAQMEIKVAIAKLLTKYRIYSDREPKGDVHIETNVRPLFQQIKDPLLMKLAKI